MEVESRTVQTCVERALRVQLGLSNIFLHSLYNRPRPYIKIQERKNL